MLLEKQGGLDQQTKMIKSLPTISQSIDRIVARVSSNRPSNYWKVEKSLVKKIKKLYREAKSIYFQSSIWGKEWSEDEIKQKLSKFVNILEDLSVEEIAVLKDKLKIFANNCIDNYAPPQIKNSPEIRQLINSSMNLMSAVSDEKLAKDFYNIAAKLIKAAIQNQQVWETKSPLAILQKTGTEAEVKNLIKNYTQHLNKLAGEGEKNYLSTEREESIIQRLTENNPTPQPSQGDTNLGDIWQNNLLTQGLSNSLSSGGSENLTEKNLLSEFEKVFLTTQSKPKWYQNPWFIGFSIVGALAVGGLVVWLLMRRKKEKITDSQYNW